MVKLCPWIFMFFIYNFFSIILRHFL
uniref:Uncharacterized protein n=1 Tax=Rhizophora mucronata TaxID=61149 RepID=A0A2P2MFD5_RHIMU